MKIKKITIHKERNYIYIGGSGNDSPNCHGVRGMRAVEKESEQLRAAATHMQR